MVMGALGTVSRRLESFLGCMGVSTPVELIQKKHAPGYCKNFKKGAGTMGVAKRKKNKNKKTENETESCEFKLWMTLGNWLMFGTDRDNPALKNNDWWGNK